MQTVARTRLPETLDGVVEMIVAVAPGEASRTTTTTAKPLLFESATRRNTHYGAVLGFVLLFYAAALTTGLWMALDVAQGLAVAERCDGRCVETTR